MEVEERDRPKKELNSQENLHLAYLHNLCFEVNDLKLNQWIKCHKQGETGAPRNAYRCGEKLMNDGAVGLGTVVRIGSEWLPPYLTRPEPEQNQSFFGLSSSLNHENLLFDKSKEQIQTMAELSYIHNFWNRSMPKGTSEYLDTKKVGSYGIRFKQSSEFGRAAVVPIKDLLGNLKGLQLLNGNGRPKQMLKGSRVIGNCHLIGKVDPIGILIICEGYATGAFLYELIAIPVCIAFCSVNLVSLANALRKKYPDISIIVAGDNDRHLVRNEGVQSAQEAVIVAGGKLMIPDFGAISPAKDVTDWLDLGRLLGNDTTVSQLNRCLGRVSKHC